MFHDRKVSTEIQSKFQQKIHPFFSTLECNSVLQYMLHTLACFRRTKVNLTENKDMTRRHNERQCTNAITLLIPIITDLSQTNFKDPN